MEIYQDLLFAIDTEQAGPFMSGMEEDMTNKSISPAKALLTKIGKKQFSTILADPPWQFKNRTGKVAPEHKRLSRYSTLTINEIKELPVPLITSNKSHLYLWVPNALLQEGLEVMKAWGFEYKTNIIWHKIRKDGGPDGRGVGFYFRNTTEIILFGIRGGIPNDESGKETSKYY